MKEANIVPPPTKWLAQFEEDLEKCEPIERTFQNNGDRYLGDGAISRDGLLAAMVFSRYLPGGVSPESVAILSNSNSDGVQVTLIGDEKDVFRFKAECKSGWYTLHQSREDNYLGDGVTEERYVKIMQFRQGSRGELIARVAQSAEFNSMYIMQSDFQATGWYRFWPK